MCGEKSSADIYRIVLESENPTTSVETSGRYTFDIKMTNVPTDYERYILYVDDFSVCLDGLSATSCLVKCNLINQNSFNSGTGGMNTTLVNLIASSAVGHTPIYQAPSAPYHITNLPTSISIDITTIANAGIDFSAGANFWILNLRIEAE